MMDAWRCRSAQTYTLFERLFLAMAAAIIAQLSPREKLPARSEGCAKCPDSQRSTWTVVWCNPGLGISRHPPVIRFRQAFKDLRSRRGNTNATLLYPSSRCWHGMDGPVLAFAWLTLVISWVAFPSFSFICHLFSSRLLLYIPIGPFPFKTLDRMAFDIVRDAVFHFDHHACAFACS